jgi:protein ImuB
MELIGLHLETVVLTEEVVQVEIHAAIVGRLGERQHELFADQWPSAPHQLAVLINRLSSRLGSGQVVRPQLQASPLPERTFRYLPATEKKRRARSEGRGRKKTNPQSEIHNPQLSVRPLLLYPEPRLVEVTGIAPDSLPQCIWLDNRRERITQHWGPERIETLWWYGPTVRRDYYRVATESAGHWWIFRELIEGRWFLHGIFA